MPAGEAEDELDVFGKAYCEKEYWDVQAWLAEVRHPLDDLSSCHASWMQPAEPVEGKEWVGLDVVPDLWKLMPDAVVKRAGESRKMKAMAVGDSKN